MTRPFGTVLPTSTQWLFNLRKFPVLVSDHLEFNTSDLKSKTEKTEHIIEVGSSRSRGCLDKKEEKVILREWLLFSSMFVLTLPRDWKLKTTPKRRCDEGEEYQPREEAAVKITWWIKKPWNRIYLKYLILTLLYHLHTYLYIYMHTFEDTSTKFWHKH